MSKPEDPKPDKTTQDLTQLKADVAALQATCAALQNQITTLTASNATLEARQHRHHAACACNAQW